eukprot:689718-Pyramimonas_sp.AAC.1
MGRAIIDFEGLILKLSTQPRAEFTEACCSRTSRQTAGLVAEGVEGQRLNHELDNDFNATKPAKMAMTCAQENSQRKMRAATTYKHFSAMLILAPEWDRGPVKRQDNLPRTNTSSEAERTRAVDLVLETLRMTGAFIESGFAIALDGALPSSVVPGLRRRAFLGGLSSRRGSTD